MTDRTNSNGAAKPYLLDIKEVVQRTKHGERTIYRLVAEGRFPKPRKSGSRNFWIPSELEEWAVSLPPRR